MRELTLHLLDLAANSVSALSQNICIEVVEDTISDRLCMSVKDDGKGMSAEMVSKVCDPFVTTRTTRKVGLGIPLLKAAAEACNGSFKIESEPGAGTYVEAEFQRSHIDRMPLGDLAATFLTLLIGTPEVHWIFRYKVNDKEFLFDDSPVKKELGDIPLSEPLVINFLRVYLSDGINSIRPQDFK
ncbi:MAG: ATP-binding protein [Anaerolineaceae bacterium]